ncbi:lipase family protein [Streptomyces bungoensis]|uniref:lipase family protein n=1 Tax=Streptomyces bungoensis TaxID=285568 RepID=UPI0036CF9FA7
MPARHPLPALAVAVAACLGAQSAAALPATASDTVVSRGVTIPAFYDPPATLPAADGTVIRSEPLPLALSLPGLDGPLPGRATRLMYKSTDSTGGPVAVTGAYLEPAAAWTHGGPRPLVAVAPGTLGQGDQCAASLGLEHPLRANGQTLTVGYEDLAIYRLLARGVAVVVTDYAGLGATDRLHTYVNRLDGAHAVLDAVRAARTLRGASVTAASPVGLYGYSQGGGATAAAAELQPSYAPDVTLAGTYAGAPPADLTAVTRAIDGSDLAGALGWAVNGFLQSDPALKPIADRHLNAKGRAALTDLSTMCVGDALIAYNSAHSTAWTTDGSSLSDVVKVEPALRDFLDRQRIGRTRPASPVRVATGVNDDLVPHAQARRLAVDWCREGADVTYVPVLDPPLGRALLNHVAPLLTDQGNAIAWLADRLSGRPAGSTCASLPLRP